FGFKPTGEAGFIHIGNVTMHKPAHDQETQKAHWHTRGAVKALAREDVTKTELSWEVECNEHTLENDALLLFGEVGDSVTQDAASDQVATIADVKKRREYEIG